MADRSPNKEEMDIWKAYCERCAGDFQNRCIRDYFTLGGVRLEDAMRRLREIQGSTKVMVAPDGELPHGTVNSLPGDSSPFGDTLRMTAATLLVFDQQLRSSDRLVHDINIYL